MDKTEFTRSISKELAFSLADGNGLSPLVFSQDIAMSRQRNVRPTSVYMVSR